MCCVFNQVYKNYLDLILNKILLYEALKFRLDFNKGTNFK